MRALKAEVVVVLRAAFAKFPRLGSYEDTSGQRAAEVRLKTFSRSDRGQVLFHNDLMTCCRVSLQDVSKRRARFHDRLSGPAHPDAPIAANNVAAGPQMAAAEGAVVQGNPAPNTPPGGLET